MFKLKQGFSLVEALVVVGLMSLVVMGMSMLVYNMTNNQAILQEKFSAIDIKNSLVSVFSRPEMCVAQLQACAPTMDLSGAPLTLPSATSVNCLTLRSGTLAASPIIAQVGTSISGFAPGTMVVSGISLMNIVATGIPNTYAGDIVVNFDPNTVKSPFRPPTVPTVIFTVTPPANAAVVSNCASTNSSTLFDVIYNVPTYNFMLPAGNFDVLLTTTYFSCEDFPISMRFDGVVVASYTGFGGGSDGCDQNTIMAKVTTTGGLHTITFTGAITLADITLRGEQWQHHWSAIPR